MPNQDQSPAYIQRGGDIIMQPPFMLERNRMYSFVVKGQLNKLQACIDRDLNAVAGDKYRYKVLSEYIMLTFSDIKKIYSTTPKDRNKGWAPEIDVVFWVPIASVSYKDGKEEIDELYWYSPYIWVDNPIAMTNGRALYGYPKTIGQFELPDHNSPDFFHAKLNSYKTYEPTTEAVWNDILSVKNLTPNESSIEKWDDFGDAVKGLVDIARDTLTSSNTLDILEEVFETLVKPELPQLFLKQMPDCDSNKAVYQALISSPAVIENFHSGGLLLGDYQLFINDVDSVPLAEDLGLSLGAQDVVFSFWLDFDFKLSRGEVLVNNTYIPPKQKIAILGGGVSSCTAAFALTSQPGWQNKYDITIYQQGWRIGGKGASGRNAKIGERIEEHGLHIWLGFYRNAFECIQKAYEELDRPRGSTLRTWEDAFKPHNFIVHMEHFNGKWTPWCLDFPVTSGNPGVGTESVTMWKLIRTVYAYLRQWLGDIREEIKLVESAEKAANKKTPETFKERLIALKERVENEVESTVDEIEDMFSNMLHFVKSLPEEIQEHSKDDQTFLKSILEEIKEWIEEEATEFLEDNANIRHLYIGIDLAIAVITGMIKDDVFNKGFDVLNHLDFRQWLRENGANETFTVQSSTVRALYDLIFAYEDGDITKANAEAGTLLRGMFRLSLCYNGSIMWKMQAGMGDTIFTPYYQVLKKRGVKFKFFHEVDELILDQHNPSVVKAITVNKQVDLIDGDEGYHPLVNVKGIGCWPSEPLYQQIIPEQAQLLQDEKIDLESFWSRWPRVYEEKFNTPLPKITLEKGKDFDIVIHGMSLAGMPYNCKQLLNHSDELKACHKNVKTTVTQAYQLWTNPSLPELGWEKYSDTGEQPVMTAWTEPVDTWAAMNQLLDKEDWTDYHLDPKNVAYFCGVQNITEIPPRDDYDFPKRSWEKVKNNCLSQIKDEMYSLFPAAGTKGSFDWNVLTSHNNLEGEERFNDQYWRSNISPCERYVLSVTGSTQYRIDTKISDFDNLYFTGDWIKTGINAGCVEAATMAGLQTSRAICGYPKVIKGEFDFGDPDL